MTEAQERLVLENEKLVMFVYGRLPKSEISLRYREDFLSEGMIGLIRAAQNFDESKGLKFSTFAIPCILNQMRIYYHKLMKFAGKEISLCATTFKPASGEELTLEDMIGDETDYSELAAAKSDIEKLQLTAIEKEVLRYRQEGFNQRRIAEAMKLSQPHVSRILKKIKNKLCG